jgi:predicted flap endonuclease-1-like 5' DNA nuclease
VYALVQEIGSADVAHDQQTLQLSRVPRSQNHPRFRRITTYITQPDLPGAALPTADGTYFAYLHVWQRHLTWLDDPQIRETALGGPDTATRTKTVWQVELLPVGDVEGLDKAGHPVHCMSVPPEWSERTAPSTGRLSAQTKPQQTSSDPCIVPSNAGYTGLENQLYRVEVHTKGTRDTATFKWSRENGSLVTDCRKQDGVRVTVGSTGRDTVLGIQPKGWVEVSDDTRELLGLPGLMLQAVDAGKDVVELAPGALTLADFPRNPKIRRWESGELAMKDTPVGGWVSLEYGIEIQFSPGTYRTGDYWLIPARAFIGPFAGDIEWPREGGSTGPSLALAPQGIKHHFCRLAVLQRRNPAPFFGAQWRVLSDCRSLFPPLTELTRLVEFCSCDQEALPDEELPESLTVRVVNGQLPVVGATVQFLVAEGGGALLGDAGQPAADSLKVTSGQGGLASCRWRLGSTYQTQRVTATLLDAAGTTVGPPVCFSARQSVPALRVLCGCGQEAMPGQPVPTNLGVVVTVGSRPLSGKVQFSIVAGGGFLGDLLVAKSVNNQPGGMPHPPTLLTVSLGEGTGTAGCRWWLGPSDPEQRVQARLVEPALRDAQGNPVDISVCFTASLSVASQVAYDPAGCAVLQKAKADTVQKAIDEFCRYLDPPVFHVENIRLSAVHFLNIGVSPVVPVPIGSIGTGDLLVNDTAVRADKLANGLEILCTAPVAPESVGGAPGLLPKPNCFVTLQMPWRQAPGIVGFSPIVLQAEVSVSDATILWTPTAKTRAWLNSGGPWEFTDTIAAQLTLLGNFIWSPGPDGQPEKYLAGVPLGRPGNGGRTDLVTFRLPPRDFQPGLVAPAPPTTAATQARVAAPSAAETPAPGASATTTPAAAVSPPPGEIFVPPFLRTAISGLRPGTFTTWFWLRPIDVGGTIGTNLAAGPPAPQPPVPAPPAATTPAGPPSPPPASLADVKGIGPVALARLEAAGITRPSEVAAMEPARLSEILQMPEARAKNITENARLVAAGTPPPPATEPPTAEPQLIDIPGIGKAYSDKLTAGGITKVPEFLALPAERLAQILGVSQDKATELQTNARQMLLP